MPLTFGEFRKICAPWAGQAGKCEDSEEVATFARSVMENLLYSGSHAGIRKICILAYRGCFTLPPEVEVPLRVRIDRTVSQIWSKWLSYYSVDASFDRCPRAEDILSEEGDYSPIQYQLPPGAWQLGVLASCDESEDARFIVSGEDEVGTEIYTTADGKQVVGESFKLKKGEIRYGKVPFKKISAINKPKTNGYVSIFAIDVSCDPPKIKQFLGDFSPSEEKPMYRLLRITDKNCAPIVHLSLLCRVRLKDNYEDNEITIFDNSFAVMLAAQRLQSEMNNNAEVANYKNQALTDILEKEAGYKKVPPGPIEVFHPLSGGAIRSLYPGRRRLGRTW